MFHNRLETSQVNWIEEVEPANNKLTAKIRYRQADQACTLTKIDQQNYSVKFDQAQRAITPGQSIVFYQNEVCLGGGVIEAMRNE